MVPFGQQFFYLISDNNRSNAPTLYHLPSVLPQRSISSSVFPYPYTISLIACSYNFFFNALFFSWMDSMFLFCVAYSPLS